MQPASQFEFETPGLHELVFDIWVQINFHPTFSFMKCSVIYQVFVPTNRTGVTRLNSSVPDAHLSRRKKCFSFREVSPIKFPDLFVAVGGVVRGRVHVGHRDLKRDDTGSILGVGRAFVHPNSKNDANMEILSSTITWRVFKSSNTFSKKKETVA